MKVVTLIPGDGIGPEIVQSVRKIFRAAGVDIKWDVINAGQTAYDECGELLPQALLDSIRKNKVALKAPLTTPVGKGFRSVNVQLRKELDLYANVRPIKTIEGILTPLKSGELIDMVIVRENTEGLYAGVEHMVGEDAAETIRVITRKASERIGRFASNIAHQRHRNNKRIGKKSRLTVVHKANIMKFTDGLFLNSIKKVSAKFLMYFELDDRIIDNMCMQLVQRPETFDVIVAPNFHGDIISDLAASLVGGLGVAPGANIGDDCAVYEAIHGTAPDIAGQNKANPTSLLMSACMMLRDKNLGMNDKADQIEAAMFKTIKEGHFVTGDIIKENGERGTGTTGSYTDAIIANL
jgi:isocitrate dehydrogenase (NAD+)